jgi:two-component system, chemotaxis family, CheB/CheR fusion protein
LPIMVRFNGSPHRVHLQVTGIREPTEAPQALVMFIEGEAVDDSLVLPESQQASDEVVRRLRQELELTQSRLRTVREESDAANEELRAANEELQSINEEYRSTSEELETSKEELQSTNEELQTVNAELKLNLDATSRANSDLQNLLAATDFGTLFLDSNLRIKRFTERATGLFSITPSDEGRPISDFSHQLEYDDLIQDTGKVLMDLAPIRRDIRSRNNLWYDMRIRPYRTVDNKIDGIVITFVDITERRQVEELLRRQADLLNQSHDAIFTWKIGDGITYWSKGAERLYGYTAEEAIGRISHELLQTRSTVSAEEREAQTAQGSWYGELMHTARDGREIVVESRHVRVSYDGELYALETNRDITEPKRAEEKMRLLMREAKHRAKKDRSRGGRRPSDRGVQS